MITLEKMLILKTISLFKYTPDELLLTVATIAEEQTAQAEELIIQQGDLGTALYMIVKGKVKVHTETKLITELGERDVFGELAALLPEKRIASITATETTLLLKINHTDLYNLMELHLGLAKGIIHFLCNRVKTIAAQQQN